MIDAIVSFFHFALYQPLLNALVFLYTYLPGGDFGVAVIVLTVAIRLVFYPLSAKAIVAQRKLALLQPKIKELQEQFKDDREQQAKKIMDLYREEKINPFSSLLPILIQVPVLIAIYQVFWQGFSAERLSEHLYGFLGNGVEIDPMLFSWLDLSQPFIALAVLAGFLQFVQGRQMMAMAPKPKKEGGPDFQDMMRKQITYIFPVILIFIMSQIPSAIPLYLSITFGFSIFQQWHMMRNNNELITE